MKAVAFCPAHVTGFFKAHLEEGEASERLGSTGAGFSIRQGVTTTVRIRDRKENEGRFSIRTGGFGSDKSDVSEFVIREFERIGDHSDKFLEIEHEIAVPVGYGLGSSGAVALSLSLALDRALGTDLGRERLGRIAHNAEVSCKTGLGDVLATFHGGFEIRSRPGAPGIGTVEKMDAGGVSVLMICFSPISTNSFLKERLSQINGLGGRMVSRLLKTRDCGHFQDMSLEFAEYVDVMTPRMRKVAGELSDAGIKCGVALFGETIFSMVPREREQEAARILEGYPEGTVIRSELDRDGARILYN